MTSTNSTRRLLATGAATAAIALTASGCGAIAERVSEEAVERAVESEGGGDVEIDFDSDSGTFSVEGQDGDANFSFDENGIQIDGTDADGNEFSLDADEDGSFTATDENGEVLSGDVDSDTGEFVIEGEDGESVFRTGSDIPDEWPGDVPEPSGLSNVSSSYQAGDGSVFIIVGGESSQSIDDFSDSFIGDLEDAGFEQESIYQDSQSRGGTFTRGDENVALNVADFGGTVQVSLTYAR